MARIRSIHPGLFTDESFIQLSDAAQIFWIGLWTEADDQGVFEWKPSTLKLRLRGACVSPVEPLLAELQALDCIRPFDVGGRKYGVVRNFQRFQRPKKPNRTYLLPDEFRIYVGSSSLSSELDDAEALRSSPREAVQRDAVPPKSELDRAQKARVPPKSELNGVHREAVPQKPEIAPQMEDGGWRMEDEGGSKQETDLRSVVAGGDRTDAAVADFQSALDPPFDAARNADLDTSARSRAVSHLGELGSRQPSAEVNEVSDRNKSVAAGIAAWNRICGARLSTVLKVTPARKAVFLRRFDDDFGQDLAAWERYCQRVAASPFLTNAGGNNRGDWKANFDFVLEPRNLVRIVEGEWDPPRPASRPSLVSPSNPRGRVVLPVSGGL